MFVNEIHETSDQTASNIAIVLVFDVWSKKPKILIELSCLRVCLIACLIAFGHVIKHGESLVTKHLTFDRGLNDIGMEIP